MSAQAVRIVCHERDDAQAAAEVLSAEGYTVMVERDRFHGEDDDEDHAWAVVVAGVADARLQQVADEHDGWVDTAEADPVTPPPPPALPTSPRRLKRPPSQDR